MDYIREFDIRLDREMYYAGETLSGCVILSTKENFKLKAVKVVLRGKAHCEWKVVVSSGQGRESQSVKEDEVFIEDRAVIWGKEKADGPCPIVPRGSHSLPFSFELPQSALPCSFESKICTIRYYVKVSLDIPYASPPQGIKYFTIIGPHIDAMDAVYLRSVVQMKSSLERTAYCCGESIRLKADIDNQSEESVRFKLRLTQYVEFFVERGPLTLTKDVSHTILEYRGDPIAPRTRSKFDTSNSIIVPVMPPTITKSTCKLLHIYYMLKVWIEMEKSGEDLHMNFPLTIATIPFRIPNSANQPFIGYEPCCDCCEGGTYIGTEFQLGQVYDGTFGTDDSGTGEQTIVLYRPVYVCVKPTSGKDRGSVSREDRGS